MNKKWWFFIAVLFFVALVMLVNLTGGKEQYIPKRIRVKMKDGSYIVADEVEQNVWVEAPSGDWARLDHYNRYWPK